MQCIERFLKFFFSKIMLRFIKQTNSDFTIIMCLTQTLGLTLAIIQRKLREISKQIDVLQDVGRKSAKTKLTEAMTSLEHENYSDAYEAFNKAADKVCMYMFV